MHNVFAAWFDTVNVGLEFLILPMFSIAMIGWEAGVTESVWPGSVCFDESAFT